VAPAPRFIARQLAGGEGAYALRGRKTRVTVRHRTRDIAILNEVFGARRVYEPPDRASIALTGPIRVLDLGGNIGLFGLYALQRWTVKSLRSFEPDPSNFALLEETARTFGHWDVVPTAVSNEAGTLRFRTGLFSESRAATDGEPATDVPVIDVFDSGRCDLLKIDIEGGEWPILTDDRLAGFARVIAVEWHTVKGRKLPADREARELLSEAGYPNQYEAPRAPGENGVIWAWT
jgi:FkbM family methyltransferase